MKESHIEPGLLQAFRLFLGIRWIVLLVFATEPLLWDRTRSFHARSYPFFILGAAELAVLSVYLYWHRLRRRLDRRYLPIALIISSVMPIIETAIFLHLVLVEPTDDATFDIQVHTAEAGTTHLMGVLLIPLFLISWQYRFRTMLFFCLGTTALQFVLVLPLLQRAALVMLDVEGPVILALLEELGIRTAIFVVLGYLITRLMTIQRQQRRALKEANDRLVTYAATLEQLAISRERNRMAREMHDTLAHTLSGLAVQLDSVTTLWESIPSEANAAIEEALATTRSGLDETRRALRDLRAAPLEDLGLALAIRTTAQDAASRGALSLEMDAPEEITGVSHKVEHCYYRVAQEALENIGRHAHAQTITVSLKQADGCLTLTISDDGQGFARETDEQEDRLGIKGMQERAEMIGASLQIESQPEQGTTVRLTWEQAQ